MKAQLGSLNNMGWVAHLPHFYFFVFKAENAQNSTFENILT